MPAGALPSMVASFSAKGAIKGLRFRVIIWVVDNLSAKGATLRVLGGVWLGVFQRTGFYVPKSCGSM